MKTKKLTLRQAWIYLAKLWDAPLLGPTGTAYLQFGLTPCYGLCGTLASMRRRGLISADVLTSAKQVIIALACKNVDGPFLFELTKAGAKRRAAFCRDQAKKCVAKRRPGE